MTATKHSPIGATDNQPEAIKVNFWLNKELSARIATLASDLENEREQFQSAWDERSEKWQESDKGNDVLAWIETIGEVKDQLENLEDKP
jgi:hypothetical protein